MQVIRPLRVGVMLRHLSDPGGIRVFSLRVTRYLAQEMPDVELHLLYRDAAQRDLLAAVPARHVVLRAPSRLAWDQWCVPIYARRARLDIVLNTKFSMPFVTGARTIAVLPGAEQWVARELFPWSDRLYSRFVQPRLLHSAAAIITHTEHGRQDIVRYLRIDADRIVVVPPGLDASMRPASPTERERVRATYRLPPRFILFLGGLSPLKNGRNLVRAFASIARDRPDIDLVFAGFRRRAVDDVFTAIHALQLDDRVHEAGYIADADLPAVYSTAECLALPSWYEGFGIPIIEAMACGCPVVTSTAGCCPEVAGGAAVLVPPGSPAEIAAGIRRIIEEPALRRACIRAGLEHSARFDWRTTGRLVGELLRALDPRSMSRAKWSAFRNPYTRRSDVEQSSSDCSR